MPLRRTALLVINAMLVCCQAATCWLWSKGVLSSFGSVYSSFGQPRPWWTEFVFSTWRYWWLAPGVCFVLALGAFIRSRSSSRPQWASTAAALIVLGAMWYAMYPLHAMVRVV